MKSEDALRLLLELKPVVIEAGDKYLRPRYFDPSYEIRFADRKSAADCVTENGMNISRAIIQYCKKIFPGSYSEEEQQGRGYRGPLFVVDPDDDTLGFVHGLYETTGTLVGLLDEENQPIAGLAYAPETRTLSLAARYSYDVMEIDGSPVPIIEPAGHIVAVQRMDAPNPKLDNFLEWLGKKLKIEVETVEGGGPGAFAAANGKYGCNFFACTVGEGNWKEWDAAGSEPILEAREWVVTDLRGNRLTYNNFDPKLHNGFLATRLGHLYPYPKWYINSRLPAEFMHKYITDYIAEFTEGYGSILVPPKVYEEWVESERAREWAEAVKTVPSQERHKLLKRRKLV